MEEIVKICVMSLLGVLLAIQLKAQKPEYSILIGFGVCILIFGFSLTRIKGLLAQFDVLKTYLGQNGNYLGILIKVIGITHICEFCAALCKDAGFGAVADQIEVLGKLSVLFSGLPVLLAVIEQISKMSM